MRAAPLVDSMVTARGALSTCVRQLTEFMTTLRQRSAGREFVIAVLAMVIAVVTGIDWIGKPLHLVHVLTLVAAGMVAGAGLTRALARWRQDRRVGSGEPAA